MKNVKKTLNSKHMLSTISNLLSEHHAINITTIDVKQTTSLTDFMLICEGTSQRHIEALVDELIKSPLITVRNKNQNKCKDDLWMVVDCLDVVVHIMHKDARHHYQLEKLWEPI
jgi:ribosome-associated protein